MTQRDDDNKIDQLLVDNCVANIQQLKDDLSVIDGNTPKTPENPVRQHERVVERCCVEIAINHLHMDIINIRSRMARRGK